MMMNFLIFLGALPLSVWLLAVLLAVIDEPNPLKPLVLLTTAAVFILIVLLLTDRAYITPLLLAMAVVLVLHIAAFWFTSKVSLGMPIYEPSPPPTPLLSEAPEETAVDATSSAESDADKPQSAEGKSPGD